MNAMLKPAARADVLIELRDVDKIYAGPAGGHTALTGCNLSIARGEFTAIVGLGKCGAILQAERRAVLGLRLNLYAGARERIARFVHHPAPNRGSRRQFDSETRDVLSRSQRQTGKRFWVFRGWSGD